MKYKCIINVQLDEYNMISEDDIIEVSKIDISTTTDENAVKGKIIPKEDCYSGNCFIEYIDILVNVFAIAFERCIEKD